MELVALSAKAAVNAVCDQLDATTEDLALSTELLAASLRRAAGLMCPTTPVALVTAVDQALAPLFDDDDRRQRCRDTLENLTALGDLLEYDKTVEESEGGLNQRRLVYAAPPYFVALSDSRILLLGIALDAIALGSDELHIIRKGHVRSVRTEDSARLRQSLSNSGLHEVPYDAWAKAPANVTADNLISAIDHQLDSEDLCSALDGLRVIDTSIDTKWYKQRWVDPRGLTGRYVGTRPRRYGADLWCYVELNDGEPLRLVDLPQGRTLERGCDQAWRLQCALDAARGHAQSYEVSPADQDRVRLDIHLPCPNWLQRRWDCIGERAGEGVFSYLFDSTDLESETKTLRDQLWMTPG